MLKEYLEKTYGRNEPIFINEIRLEGVKDNSLRQSFTRMVKAGELAHFDTGVYYLPNSSRLLKKSYLDPMKVIMRKYIKNSDETYGYFSGAAFANQLGLTSQMPAVLEIVSNRETTKGRILTVGTQKLRLKCSTIPITDENAGLLQFLNAISQAEKYSELTDEETGRVLRKYARQQNYSRKLLSLALPALTGNTAKKLIEWGIIYEFAS